MANRTPTQKQCNSAASFLRLSERQDAALQVYGAGKRIWIEREAVLIKRLYEPPSRLSSSPTRTVFLDQKARETASSDKTDSTRESLQSRFSSPGEAATFKAQPLESDLLKLKYPNYLS